MRCQAAGVRPKQWHDASPFLLKSDKNGMPRAGASPEEGQLGVQAFLAELRGDWKWLQKLFHFPAWNKGTGFCWLCKCLLPHLRCLDTAAAPWRYQRLAGEAFLQLCREQGIPVSEIFSLPGVSPEIVFPDWMHSADMGVAQDVIAHVFHEVLPRMPGLSLSERTKCLFSHILQYYETSSVGDRLQTLEPKAFTSSGVGKANKLKSKAAVARGLVPFLPALTRRFLTSGSVHDLTVQSVAQNLAACYRLHDAPGQDLQKACRRFANSYAALEREVLASAPSSAHWRIKPKLHLFQELCEYSPRAARLFWCYKDETFGDICAKPFQRRGGKDNPGKNSETLLLRWCCLTPFPHPF